MDKRASREEVPYGGWGGIRTHDTVARVPVFKTGALNRSATHPAFLITDGPHNAYCRNRCGGNERETAPAALWFYFVNGRIANREN